MNGKDMNYVGTMYDAFQRGSKLMAERSALNLGISFQAAERVYHGDDCKRKKRLPGFCRGDGLSVLFAFSC